MFCLLKRKAEQIFADHEIWKIVPDRDRREIYEDILQQLEKREKVYSSFDEHLFV
jgi:hypothetical protein